MGLKCECNKCDFCTKSKPDKLGGLTCNVNEYTTEYVRDKYCSEAIKLMIKTMQSVANDKED